MSSPDQGKRPGRVRGPSGRFVRSIDVAERDAQACRLRTRGLSYREIAEQLGYADEAHAYRAVKKILLETVQEAGDELRAVEVARLDALLAKVWAVLERRHLHVSSGRIVTIELDDGTKVPLEDDGPTLAAADRVLAIAKRRAELLGLDAPKKIETDGVVRYVIEGVDLGKLT